MAHYGEIQIGRLLVREDRQVGLSVSESGAVISLKGQESRTRLSANELKRRVDDLIALQDAAMVPVTFTQKPELNAYYTVESVTAAYESWPDQATGNLPWTITMSRVGYDSDTDIESRLSGPITRTNNFATTGERWLAPPIGHYGFTANSTTPPVFSRVGDEGALLVYRSLGANINPRFGCAVTDYQKGRVRLKDANGIERVAERFQAPASGWELSNSLVKVTIPVAGTLRTECYLSGAWRIKDWDIQDTANLEPWTTMSVLVNTPEQVTIRLMKALIPGRRTLDLTLRRGSRFIEGYLQRSEAGTLTVKLRTIEAGTQTAGYIWANAADGNGMKYILGSAKTFTATASQGKISLASTLSMDFFLGLTINVPLDGDEAPDLYAQYIGSPYETVRGVRR